MKKRFPKIQFLVTTHSPLICQAADLNGIFVLPSPGSDEPARALTPEEYQKVVALRPDTILLGPAFGLNNTRSPVAVASRKRWAQLQAKKRGGGLLAPEEKAEEIKLAPMERLFVWDNFLLCCGKCNRIKRTKFPLDADGKPLLIDPTTEDPWGSLDFDPDTGNLTARYDLATIWPVPKGANTVVIFELDCREALSEGFRRSYHRILMAVTEFLADSAGPPTTLTEKLEKADEHFLLPWCFHGPGTKMDKFPALRTSHPEVWVSCQPAFPR